MKNFGGGALGVWITRLTWVLYGQKKSTKARNRTEELLTGRQDDHPRDAPFVAIGPPPTPRLVKVAQVKNL